MVINTEFKTKTYAYSLHISKTFIDKKSGINQIKHKMLIQRINLYKIPE